MTQVDEEDGQVWMCTGDEAVMDEEGYVQSEREVHIAPLSEWVGLTQCTTNPMQSWEG